MDSFNELIGSFIGAMLLYFFADILISIPGHFIYCALFTKAEYDPDHRHDVEVSDIKVLATGIVFWIVILGGAYGVYRIAI